MVNIPFAGVRGAGGVSEILVEVIAEMAAPDEVTAEATVSERNDVGGLVGEEGERDDETLVSLAAGDGAANQALAKQFEDAVVAGARELHPSVDAKEGGGGMRLEFRSVQGAREEGGRKREVHELGSGP